MAYKRARYRLFQFSNESFELGPLCRKGYLDGLEKPESLDPAHKWNGFYNAFEITVTHFFKWFYHPDVDADDRPKPAIVAGLKKAKPR